MVSKASQADNTPSVSRRKSRMGETPDLGTPDTSNKSGRKARKTSGTSSLDTRNDGPTKTLSSSDKTSFGGELCRVIFHLLFVVALVFVSICGFEYSMLQYIEWEEPKQEEPMSRTYRGAAFITKDFDCSILVRRCHMGKAVMEKSALHTCMIPALVCVSMLRPDMFNTRPPWNQHYYVSLRYVNSTVDSVGKKKEVFNSFHEKIKRSHMLTRLKAYNDEFKIPFPSSKGIPRENQLFFIPWEIVDMEEKYSKDFEYTDLNLDDSPDCILPKVNTGLGRRDWIRSMTNELPKDFKTPSHSINIWKRDTVQRASHYRVDTVPGFTGAFMKKIIEVCSVIMETEVSHSTRRIHAFTDDTVLLIYRHVLIYAIRNPFLMLFREGLWKERTPAFDPDSIIDLDDWQRMPTLTGSSTSISFSFGARTSKSSSKLSIPETLTLTIAEAKSKLGDKFFDVNAPVRITAGMTNIEVASSAQGERAFHSNIITTLRILLRLNIHTTLKSSHLNHILHIPMAFFSMTEKKMVFDNYNITTPLRGKLCTMITRCATPYDQATNDWRTRFNGTTSIMYNIGRDIISRIDTTQDKRNYAVGY